MRARRTFGQVSVQEQDQTLCFQVASIRPNMRMQEVPVLVIPPEVIENARTGERSAVEQLIECIWPHTYRIALSVVADNSLAEEAAQESCAIIFRTIPSLKPIQAFRVWLYRIVARESLRLAVRTPTGFAPTPRGEIEPALRLDIIQALHRLEPGQRAAVVLHYYIGLNSVEIANALGISGPAVRFRLMCARKALAKYLRYDAQIITEVCK